MKTQYFAATSQEDMNKWIYVMRLAAAGQYDAKYVIIPFCYQNVQ